MVGGDFWTVGSDFRTLGSDLRTVGSDSGAFGSDFPAGSRIMQLMLTKIRSYIGSRFWGRTFAEGSLRTWMGEAAVRSYINESVTGSPHVWPIEWLQSFV